MAAAASSDRRPTHIVPQPNIESAAMHAAAAEMHEDAVAHPGLMLVSASKFCLVCFSMFSEKSTATTPAKRPDLANRRENSPLPQLRSTSTWSKHGCTRS